MMQPPNEDFISTKPNKKNKYKDMRRTVARQFKALGVIQVIVGVLCIAFNSVDLTTLHLFYNPSVIGHGIWSGVMFIVTGCFGIIGGIRKTGCIVVTFQVLSIISSIFGCILFGIAAFSLTITYGPRPYNNIDRAAYNTSMTMEFLILFLAVLETVISIWASSLVCCHINCCRNCCARCCYNCCCPPNQDIEELMLTWARNNQQQPMVTFNAQRQPMTTPNQEQMIMMIRENPQHPMIMKNSQQILIDAGRQPVSYDPQASRSHYTALSSRERKNEGAYSGIYSEIIEGYEIPDIETSSEITHNACLTDYEAMTTGQTGNRSSFRKS